MEDKIYKKIFNSLDNSNFEDIFELALRSNDPHLKCAAQIYVCINGYMAGYLRFKNDAGYIRKESYSFPEWKIIFLGTYSFVLYFIKEKVIYKLIVKGNEKLGDTVLKVIKVIEKTEGMKNED